MTLPNVITSDHSLSTWDRTAISSELSRDCAFYREITGNEIDINTDHVAETVEQMVARLKLDLIDSATIRGLVATALFQEGYTDLSRYSSRVGIPARNAWGIIRGNGDWDNANLTPGPETSHKLGADALFKDLYSRILPEHIMKAHADGTIHIHDLDYFMTRIFCKSWDLRYTFYYGLKPDGTGENAIAAGPAMHADVAILQACKVLGLAQCNCAGGQGLLHGTVFLAPYMAGMSYEEIYQYMQMIFYELNQMYVSRGGQPCFSSINLNPGVPKILENAPVVYKGKVWQDKKYGDYEREVRLMFKACMELSLKGDDNSRMFPFPKLEVSVEKKFCDDKTWNQDLLRWFDKDRECFSYTEHTEKYGDLPFSEVVAPSYKSLYELAFKVVAKYGTLYFDNMLPEKRKAETSVACMQCCLSEDTLIPVMLEDGIVLKDIKDLTKSDKIHTTFGDNGWHAFEDMLIKHTTDLLNQVMVCGGRRIICTDDHRIPVMKDGQLEWVYPRNLSKNTSMLVDCSLPDNGSDDIGLAYLLGLYAAEGSSHKVSYKNERHLSWSFGAHEQNLISNTETLIKKYFGYDAKTYLSHNKLGKTVNIHTKKIYDWFESNVGSLKGYHMEVPPYLFFATKDAKWAYLMGYYQGDGCLRKNGKRSHIYRVELNTISKKLAEGVLLLAGSLGFQFHYTENVPTDPRKKKRYILTLNKRDEIRNFFGAQYGSPKWEAPVKKITKIPYNGLVYDPVNTKNHDFITGQGIVSSNCAYQFVDDSETDSNFHDRLNFVGGKHFDLGGMQAGSVNLPRIAYKANHDDKAFLVELFRVMDILAEMFLCKKAAILQTQSRLQFLTQTPVDRNNGLPGDRYVDFDGLVYEMGIVGLNEAMQHHTGKQLHEGDLGFAKKILSAMGDYCKVLTQRHGIKIVLARTPAETTAQRFAASDLVRYPEFALAVVKGDLEHSAGKNPAIYYSNGFAPDVAADIGIFERLQIENALWSYVDGGAITHVWLGEGNPDPHGLMEFAFRIFRNTDIGYLAFTKDLSQCAKCKHIEGGIIKKCTNCGSDEIDWYSRITGYYSKVGSHRGGEVKAKWNAAKVAEWERRNRVTI